MTCAGKLADVAPSKRMPLPALRSSPARLRRKVDLPAPLAPMIGHDLARRDLEIDAEERLEVAIEGGQGPGLEERSCRGIHAHIDFPNLARGHHRSGLALRINAPRWSTSSRSTTRSSARTHMLDPDDRDALALQRR